MAIFGQFPRPMMNVLAVIHLTIADSKAIALGIHLGPASQGLAF